MALLFQLSAPAFSFAGEDSGVLKVAGTVSDETPIAEPVVPAANVVAQGSSCQQACFYQYKSGTDFCYSTSSASEELNICIMSQREMFKACSKTCQGL